MLKEEELKNIENKLKESDKIYGTMYAEVYDGSNGLIEITNFKILKGNKNTTVIYYEWGADEGEYNLYQLSDYGITWGFSESEIRAEYSKTEAKIKGLSTLQKFLELIDENRDPRLDKILIRFIINDLKI